MSFIRSVVLAITGLAGVSLLAAREARAAEASERGPGKFGTPSDGLSVGAGVNESDPGYVGYHSRVTPFPLFSYRYDRFFVSGVTAGYVAVNNDAFTMSLVLLPQTMRLRSSDSPQLAGLQPRQWSIDGGLTLSSSRTWGTVSLSALQDVLARNKGTQLGLRYGYPIPLGGGVLSPGVGVTWESANLTRYYYGISNAEALPDRPAYSPGSASNPSAGLSYAHPISTRCRLTASADYTHFDRSIRQSPIIDKSNVMGFTLAFTYSFARH
jgi:MipA family protein